MGRDRDKVREERERRERNRQREGNKKRWELGKAHLLKRTIVNVHWKCSRLPCQDPKDSPAQMPEF